MIVGTAAATPEPDARGSAMFSVVAAAGRRTRSTTSRPPSAPAWATTWIPGSVRPGPLVAIGAVPAPPVKDPAAVGVDPEVASEAPGVVEAALGGVAADAWGSAVRPNAHTAPTPKATASTRPIMRWTSTERGMQSPPFPMAMSFMPDSQPILDPR